MIVEGGKLLELENAKTGEVLMSGTVDELLYEFCNHDEVCEAILRVGSGEVRISNVQGTKNPKLKITEVS